ncbi:hypothetical protein NEMIN01_2086 [Nematocida minor]|uniref:uncharacterized protein n=1 Tax=Nematocida minor TaxID=1912983 RepID=UPI00221FE088|nr:uncharacterized protein NEMIN01_2086 [Nematocida minor]KAI5192573.1 hypothetical protein NEMIN01_2086 [Nematocida minor]
MDIRTLPIISEVYGEEGSGRNSFCFCIAKDCNSLWIEAYSKLSTKRAYSLRMDLESIYICKIKNIHGLLYSLKKGEIGNFVKDHRIDVIIINGLEELEEVGEIGTKNYVEVVSHLKQLYLSLKVKSILISRVHTNIANENSVRYSENISPSTIFTLNTINKQSTEEKKERLQSDILYQKYFKQHVPPSSIKGTLWEYAMPTKLYIKRTSSPSVRIITVVKPEISHPPQYTMEIGPTSVTIERI